jgi:hypothetical protein
MVGTAGAGTKIEKGRRLLRASHFDSSAEEMKWFYFDVLNTGESLGVAMPHLAALRERIESYPANQASRFSISTLRARSKLRRPRQSGFPDQHIRGLGKG